MQPPYFFTKDTFICSEAKDVLVWTASKNGIFTVMSCYSLLLEANEG